MADTLWHIEWGDGDTIFVIAPDKETAIERMPDGKDMINNVTRWDALYQTIFKAGYEQGLKEQGTPHADAEIRLADKEYAERYRIEWMRDNQWKEAFAAGKQEGRKEVMEFKCDECSTPNFTHLVIPNVKLKKWRIKDGE